jgi:uncharacterized protein YjaZ
MRPSQLHAATSTMCNHTVQTRTYQESRLLCVCTCFVLSTLYVPSCTRENPDVVFYRYDGYTFSGAEQRTIRTIAENAVRDARVLLPNLPANLTIRVNPGKKVNDEIGATSSHSLPNVVYWTVDPSRHGGVAEIARTHLRATLFHHFHRLARLKHRPDVTLMDHVVSLGMATAFERDAGGKAYPWGLYPGDVTAWVAELIALPATDDLNRWMFRHPDGRRWVGIRAGTYLVDRAMSASGKSAAELVSLPSAEIIRLALKQ